MIAPEDCQSMAEVRAGIDALDLQIVELLAIRFRFMTAAARIKADRGAVRDEDRKAQVIANAKAAAERAGVPPRGRRRHLGTAGRGIDRLRIRSLGRTPRLT